MTFSASRRALLAAAAAGLGLRLSPGMAGTCEGSGTARTLPVGTAGGLFVGLKSYPRTLALADREVVLTFDDGPAANTPRVLDALACAGTRATFFLIGRNAEAQPALVRRIAAEGHTIACHSHTHPWTMRQRSPEAARTDIQSGFDAISAALGKPCAPFFRYPGFADTEDLNTWLASRDIGVFGCDLWASDWTPMSPAAQLALVRQRLERARRGIILFHDTQAQTAAMIPDFLAGLASGGYRVVHIAAGPGQADTLAAGPGWTSETERTIAMARHH
ncbi:polysaccharide deacetylase family protein [uncultured Alsobacter sp.]|uniref:polysaccharide deacetylase family protein n=1 Tax=uncultured Alsobacter sp. TaxID=1748258 RepID=UPI0025D666FF|nr:polysaccharide deacetylase family protein [uncultured Alsobacter sp.]